MLAGSGQEPRGIESLRRVSRDNAVRGAVQLPAAVVEPAHPFQAYHQHSAREDHQETGATMVRMLVGLLHIAYLCASELQVPCLSTNSW